MSTAWNPKPIVRVHIRRRVSAAVLVLDDFTGRPITAADLEVRAAEILDRPVRKGDGYFLFLDSPTPTLTVTARAWAYHTATVQVDLSALPALRPVVRLRLTPNRNYSIPLHTTCLEGAAPPDTQVRAFCLNDPKPLRLLYDYAAGGPEGGAADPDLRPRRLRPGGQALRPAAQGGGAGRVLHRAGPAGGGGGGLPAGRAPGAGL